MKYLTAEELLKSHREDAFNILSNIPRGAHTVRDGKAFEVLDKYSVLYCPGKDINILDCGPATGAFLSSLYDKGYSNLHSVDIDNYLSEENKRKIKESKFADLSWKPLDWPDGFFHLVTGWCILPHLENPHNMIREVHRVLAKGGLFITSLPHIDSIHARREFLKKGDFGRYRANCNHISLFSKGVFQNTVLRYFKLVGTEYYVNPKILNRGFKGRVRKLVLRFLDRPLFSSLKKKLEHRLGFNVVYVLQK